MRVRTFAMIVLVLGGLLALGGLGLNNLPVLEQEFRLWGGKTLGVGWVLLLSFVTGLGIAFLAGFSRETGLMLERWRQRKASRKSEEIEEEYSRGLVAVLEGREDEALRHFRAVLERDSRHFNTLIKQGEILRSQEKYSEAIEYHRKAHHIKEDDTRPLYALVEDHEAKGDMDRARTVLGRIISINKNSVAAWRKLRSLLIKEQNWEKALEAHERVTKLSGPGSPTATADRQCGLGISYEMAMVRLNGGKPREAISALRRILKDDDTFIPAHVGLGEALRIDGQESEAVRAWYSGFEITGSPIFLTMLEEHYLSREQPLAAIEALKRCITRARRDTVARFYLGKLYFRLEMLDDALALLTSLEGRAEYAPSLHYLLGHIHERRQQHADAAQAYRKVIKEMDLVKLDYRCRSCGAMNVEWADRCTTCRLWNTVEVNFREEIALEELGLAPAPIYSSDS